MKCERKVLRILASIILVISFICFDVSPIKPNIMQTVQAASRPAPIVSEITLFVGEYNFAIEFTKLSPKATITYTTSNKSIAEVTKKGIIKPVSKGSAVIKVVIKQNGKKYTSKIKVTVKLKQTVTPTPAPASVYSAPKGSDKAAYLSGLNLSKQSGTYYTTTKEEYIQTTRFNLYLDKGVQVPVNVIDLINYIMDRIEETTGYKFYVQHYNSDKYYQGMDYELDQYFDTADQLKKMDSKDERVDIVVAYNKLEVEAYASSAGGVLLSPADINLLDGKADILIHELLHVVYYQHGCSMGSAMDEGFTTYFTDQIVKKDTRLKSTYNAYEELKDYENIISEDTFENLFINYTLGQSRYQLGFRLINFIIEKYGMQSYQKLHEKVTEVCQGESDPPMETIAKVIKNVLSEDFFKEFSRWHSDNLTRFGDKELTAKEVWKIEYFGNQGYLRKYYGYDAHVVIPNTVNNIQPEAFMNCSTVITIEIPNTVTVIAGGSFANCKNLKEISIPDSVSAIYSSTFSHCSSLEKVKLPNNIQKIPLSTFSNCTSLKEISIPEGVTTIENYAFGDCSSLETAYLPNSLTTIDSCAFYQCGLKSIVIPQNVNSIAFSAFAFSSKLENIKLPDGLKVLNDTLFWQCKSLKQITLPKELIKIGDSTFNGTGLTSVTIPDKVEEIYDYAFANCIDLKTIDIPKGVKKIGDQTFFNCKNLTISGEKGSYAETYAKSHKFKFAAK